MKQFLLFTLLCVFGSASDLPPSNKPVSKVHFFESKGGFNSGNESNFNILKGAEYSLGGNLFFEKNKYDETAFHEIKIGTKSSNFLCHLLSTFTGIKCTSNSFYKLYSLDSRQITILNLGQPKSSIDNSFKNPPLFWQYEWFILLFFSSIILIFYCVWIKRLRIKKRELNQVIYRLLAEQKALQSQLDPHFVFNIIASIQFLILDGANDKANTFLSMFSKSMRNIIGQSNNSDILLENEIRFLTEYIEMERFRLEDKFEYSIQSSLSEKELKQPIPPFIIQPFIENAIQHGLKNKQELGKLLVTYDIEGDFLVVTVQDNGIGRKAAKKYKNTDRSPVPEKAHGKRVIIDRLNLYNGKRENVTVMDKIDANGNACGTTVRVFILLKSKPIQPAQNKEETTIFG